MKMEQPHTQEQQIKTSKAPKQVFIAGMFYVFLLTTLGAFLLHLFGLDWFRANIKIEDPSTNVQIGIKAVLKAFELTFVYKLLSKRSFLFCIVCAAVHTGVVGFLPTGLYQSAADALLMLLVPLITRKDIGWIILDFLFLYALMTLYSLMLTAAKFGGLSMDYTYSFYANVAAMLDFKLFIVTLYLYTRYKGGIKLWMKKRRLLTP